MLGGPKFVPPSEKVNIAIVGAGGQARINARSLFHEKDAQIIAVCDVAEQIDLSGFWYGGSGGRLPLKAEIEKRCGEAKPGFRCADYEDFRKMLEKEKAIDAVLCATPDHAHAVVSVRLLRKNASGGRRTVLRRDEYSSLPRRAEHSSGDSKVSQ